jgi:hypothetical protein
MVQSAATCGGVDPCDVSNGLIGNSPGTAITGTFVNDNAYEMNTDAANSCADDQVTAFNELRVLTGGSLATEIGGTTFAPGVWVSAGAVNIALTNKRVYLDADGDADAVFIFSIASTLITCANSEIVLLNGAQAKNVYWAVGTALNMGADATLAGNVLCGTSATIGSNSIIDGRLLAQAAVTCATACKVGPSEGLQ